jgi:hypothetical protein
MMHRGSSKLRALLATVAVSFVASGCGNEEPQVKLGRLAVQGPVAGASADEWQMILEHERREIMYFECMRNMPVCGTNGVRYANPCQATLAGVEVVAGLDADAGGC